MWAAPAASRAWRSLRPCATPPGVAEHDAPAARGAGDLILDMVRLSLQEPRRPWQWRDAAGGVQGPHPRLHRPASARPGAVDRPHRAGAQLQQAPPRTSGLRRRGRSRCRTTSCSAGCKPACASSGTRCTGSARSPTSRSPGASTTARISAACSANTPACHRAISPPPLPH